MAEEGWLMPFPPPTPDPAVTESYLQHVVVCRHSGDAARLRELEVKLRQAEASNDALDVAVRTAHAQIAKLELRLAEAKK
jgi:hypothetical protein